MQRLNDYGQTIGPELPGWTPRPLPARTTMQGRHCRLVPLDAKRHAAELFAADALDADARAWTYLFVGPLTTLAEYEAWAATAESTSDPLYFAVLDPVTGKAVGRASYMRIDPRVGSIEVGDIKFSSLLQRTPAATEAIYLMLKHAFDDLGYRRFEWKCDNFNEPSKAAALRFGFSYEGLFRQATIYKGRSRDTAWFSIIDSEWPAIRAGFDAWLAAENFDASGRQSASLADKIRIARKG